MAASNWICVVSALTFGVVGSVTSQSINLEQHLQHLTTIRNPSASSNTAWYEARDYISHQFFSYNLTTKFHTFNTSVNVNNNGGTTFTGTNVIGIAEGPADGPVLLVGADFDTTVSQKSPLEDNGAGIAALLEVARLYMDQYHSNELNNVTGTVLFVAFDINTVEYEGQPSGKAGSYLFLHQWLWSYLGQSSERFYGAIILDSISKYNMEERSQVLPDDFQDVFPEAYGDIVNRTNKGDFLALFTRHSEASRRLTEALFDSYEKDRKAMMFRLLDLTLRDGSKYGETFRMFDHQSQFHFWTFQPADKPVPLPAILLTDTDVHRKSPNTCSTNPCTAEEFLTRPAKAFIEKTVESLVQTLASLLIESPEVVTDSGIGLVPSISIMVLAVCLGKLLH
ncbi:uncharacterized protein LOC135210087 [Macrobrachium nipponense]|uniref:uncharacterized protein LOC135210087 n=1 Tax=Macrobrachium nipponense TaxID=159736 RepID=UPI0030C7A3F3